MASDNLTRKYGSFRYSDPEPAPIVVEQGTWLGAHVIVTAGSKIGQGALVEAGAVATGNIPDNAFAGGVPAHVIKAIIE